MFKHSLVYSVALAIVVSAAPPVAHAVTFEVTDLSQYANGLEPNFENFSFHSFYAAGISPNGQYISGSVWVWIDSWAMYNPLAFRYTNGQSVVSPISTDNYYSDYWTNGRGTSVNNSGRVTGYAGDINPDPDEYQAVTFISSVAPAVDASDIMIGSSHPCTYYDSINNNGQVSAVVNHAGVPYNYLMYYDGTTGHDLGLAEQLTSDYTEINDSAWIVGTVQLDSEVGDVAFVNRPDGQGGRETITLGVNSFGRDINNSGKIIGSASFPGGLRAFISVPDEQGDYGPVQDLGALGELPGQGSSFAKAINNNNWIVGDSGSGFLCMDEGSGYVMYDLNSLLTPGDQAIWTIGDAYAVADTGQILATASNSSGTYSVLLTPIPEPSTLVLLAAGAVALIGFAWRRR